MVTFNLLLGKLTVVFCFTIHNPDKFLAITVSYIEYVIIGVVVKCLARSQQ